MKRRGRKTLEWERVRRDLKREFSAAGITRCESCGSSFGLTFAHRLKRRFITTPEELRCAALLCHTCHEGVENTKHEQMFRMVTKIIERAGRPVPFRDWQDRPAGVV